ncbi:MAG: hypothetical protein ABIP67_17105, partial [Burkholderiales bacterium]
MIPLTIATLKAALRHYDAGSRPYRFIQPRSWYLLSSKGRAYPLKYVYAMAIGRAPGKFNTSEPIRDIPKLGFEIKRERKTLEIEFAKRVASSLKHPKARADRLAKAPRLPKQTIREVVVYERNPDVVAEVLARAKGRCGSCGNAAPFKKRNDGAPYLEVHH